jgi:hypothetical protein
LAQPTLLDRWISLSFLIQQPTLPIEQQSIPFPRCVVTVNHVGKTSVASHGPQSNEEEVMPEVMLSDLYQRHDSSHTPTALIAKVKAIKTDNAMIMSYHYAVSVNIPA